MTEPDREIQRNENVDSREQQDKDIYGEPRDRERVEVSEEEDQQVEGALKNRDRVRAEEDEKLRHRDRLDDQRDDTKDQRNRARLTEFFLAPIRNAEPVCKRCGAFIGSPITHAQWHENERTRRSR